ncbi:MAG TPA: septal ring lytic transglycosylase RlpA family protein, partial [Solirubrobacteraceae bacterium]|nr:septal ring lytic transglycosylase RlpA family protein [Solirubrobacteraceae bacterium]
MRAHVSIRWIVACLAAVLATPAAALAKNASGGALAPGGGLLTVQPASVGGAAPALATDPSAPSALSPPSGTLIQSVAVVRGHLAHVRTAAGVVLDVFDAHRGWLAVARARTDPAGNFAFSWRPLHIGRFLLRASLATRPATTDPIAGIEVYRSVIATYFGPGSYGTRTACGEILTPELVGVAHPKLPCGTMVDILYGGQTISVPVVDRGPYANGAAFDLTMATAQALGVS